MNTPFSFLFSSSSTATEPHDGLNQTEREAILDLLYFCMCADQELHPAENAAIVDAVMKFDWESGVEYDNFAAKSLARAQKAVATPQTRRAALNQIGKRLVSTETKSRALATCKRVFQADGDVAAVEREVFVEIKEALDWPG
jgi:uncharacterized tellurite resistance protein B-like protein